MMFVFTESVPTILVWLVWIGVFISLFAANELSRRFKWVGLGCFVILPVVLTVLWLTALKDTSYMDWFHLAKVYSSTAGCIGFWCIRHIKKLQHNKIALCFPPLILAINILEACSRDFQVSQYATPVVEYMNNQVQYYVGGSWNIMNGIAGILNIITISGWFGICIRRKTANDNSRDMLWPDMMWFWIVAYDLWNFAYTYNCLPTHAWYCGFALLLAPTVCAFTLGKGAWLQHRAHTLALWCMFAQVFPLFQDASRFTTVTSVYGEGGIAAAMGESMPVAADPLAQGLIAVLSIAVNVFAFAYILRRAKSQNKNPWKNEIFTDTRDYIEAMERA